MIPLSAFSCFSSIVFMEQFDDHSPKPERPERASDPAPERTSERPRYDIVTDAESSAAVFPHARYAFVTVILIFLGYQFAGEALVTLFARNSAVSSWSWFASSSSQSLLRSIMQGLGQALFMLIPAIVITQYSPLRTQGLMRFGGQVSTVQWVIGLLGVVAVHLFAQGFAGVQESLVPDRFYPLYKQSQMSVENAYTGLLGGSTAWDAARAFVVGAVIPAFSEEILFRGVMQRSLEAVRTPQRAIVLTALIFAILHWNPILLVPLVVIGVYLGLLAYHTQSLALPIVAHFVNNALAIVVLYVPEPLAEKIPHVPHWFWFWVGAMGIVVATTLLLRTPQSSANTGAGVSTDTDGAESKSGDEY
jgi:uncharacterized protein